MSLDLADALDPRVPWIRKLHALDSAWKSDRPGQRERAIERQGADLKLALRSGGRAVSVRTLPTADVVYPVKYAFNGALPGALAVMRSRTLLVQVRTEGGTRNILFNPSDGPANLATPYFRNLVGKFPKSIQPLLRPPPNRCADQLAELGLSPEDIDIIAFDHFHTQDLRPLLGAPGVPARFPNAYLLAPRAEWLDWDDLPQMQRAWFVRDGKLGVPQERVVLTDNDLWLGEGVLLLRTPGHTTGNQTLFVHAEGGVFGCSENGTCADSWAPRASRIRGLREHVSNLSLHVVLNANTPELCSHQYTSMLLERAVVDRVASEPDFYQMFPSTELTWSPLTPHIRPSMSFGQVTSGEVDKRARATVRAYQSSDVRA
jgi:hypothetical protein